MKLKKLSPRDTVAVISPSSGMAGEVPWLFELGLQRLQEKFNLKVKEYPTTRVEGSSLKDRARDIMAAFTDKDVKAVIAAIGGSDQIQLLKYLDPQLIKNNAKPFFGYSDNTHLHMFLWNLGIPSYYGGSVLTQFAMQHSMCELTVETLNKALFDGGSYELKASKEYNDVGLDWFDQSTLTQKRSFEKNVGFIWDGTHDAEGILWGGCVESLIAQMSTGKYLPRDEDLNNTVLMLETSEEMPPHWVVQYLLTGMGERGWLDTFNAILIGRPQAWSFDNTNDAAAKQQYSTQQRQTVIDTVRMYNTDIPIVQNVDFGHTDPQAIMPLRQKAEVLASEKRIILHY